MKTAKIESSDSLQSLDEFEVPEGWVYKKIGEIVSPSKEKIEPTADSTIPYIGLEHIESNTSKIIGHGIASDAKSTKTVFHAGDVLYGKLRPYLNKVTIPDFDGVCSTDILVFNQNQTIDSRYLMRYLSTREVVEYANLKSKGISLPRVSFENLAEIPIPLPPLAEQQRIVARVEALLSHVNAARDKLSHVPLIMKKFRQGVLSAASTGRLTEGWREENPEIECIDISAINLHQKYQKSELNNQELSDVPEKWQWSKLFETVEIIMGQSPPGVSYNQNGKGIPLINGPVEFGPTPFSETIRSKFTTHPTKLCRKNDLLLCVRGSTTGRINIAGFDACIGRGVAALRSKTDQKYLILFIHSKEDYIYSLGIGSTFPNISSDMIANLDFPLPPVAEQHEIVRRVESLFERADAIEREVVVARRRCERLTQAVLGKAFVGKL